LTTLQTSHASTLCRPMSMNSRTQTENTETMDNETQTSNDWLMKEVKMAAERKTVDRSDDDNEFILVTCSRCQQPIETEQYEKIAVRMQRYCE
jgi:predicted nucleic-acid-binding Zn-ribbon protein